MFFHKVFKSLINAIWCHFCDFFKKTLQFLKNSLNLNRIFSKHLPPSYASNTDANSRMKCMQNQISREVALCLSCFGAIWGLESSSSTTNPSHKDRFSQDTNKYSQLWELINLRKLLIVFAKPETCAIPLYLKIC